jgi:hypothetical protein
LAIPVAVYAANAGDPTGTVGRVDTLMAREAGDAASQPPAGRHGIPASYIGAYYPAGLAHDVPPPVYVAPTAYLVPMQAYTPY